MPHDPYRVNQNDALAAWPIRGLARRFPAKDLATLKTLLQEYAYRLPGDLPHGVKGDLANINREEDLMDGSRHLAKLLAKRSGYPQAGIQAALDLLLVVDDVRFAARLGGIRSS